MTDQQAEISALKQQAVEQLNAMRGQILTGDFKLKQEVRSAIVADSAIEFDTAPDLNSLLKAKGMSRKQRRTFLSSRGKAPRQQPAHTKRAQAIANANAARLKEKA